MKKENRMVTDEEIRVIFGKAMLMAVASIIYFFAVLVLYLLNRQESL